MYHICHIRLYFYLWS